MRALLLDDGDGDRQIRSCTRRVPHLVAGDAVGPLGISQENSDRAAHRNRLGGGEVELQDLDRPRLNVHRLHYYVGAISILIAPSVHQIVNLLTQAVRLVCDTIREIAEVHWQMTQSHLTHPTILGPAPLIVDLKDQTVQIDTTALERRDPELVVSSLTLPNLKRRITDVRENRERLSLAIGNAIGLIHQETALIGRDKLVARVLFGGLLDHNGGIGIDGLGRVAFVIRLRLVGRNVGGGGDGRCRDDLVQPVVGASGKDEKRKKGKETHCNIRGEGKNVPYTTRSILIVWRTGHSSPSSI